MNNKNNIKNMISAVQAVIIKFNLQWTGFAAYEAANEKLNDTVTEIEDAEEVQKTIIKGFTALKKARRKTMADKAMVMSKKVRAWAISRGDLALAGKMRIAISKFLYGKANNAVTYANNILTAVNEMPVADRTAYEISAQDITEFVAAIAGFVTVISLPRDRIVIRKNATQKLKELFKKGSNILKDELDGLMENFNPGDFYSEYFNARRIVDLIRHTVIAGNVTDDAGVDLKKVKVTLRGKDKVTSEEKVVYEEMTTKDGNFKKSELNPELDWDVTFELETYETLTLSDIELSPGEHEEVEVKLNKIV